MQGRKCNNMYSPDQREKLRSALLQAYKNAKKKDKKWLWTSTVESTKENLEHNISDEVRKKWPKPYCDVKTIDFGEPYNFSRFPKGEITDPEDELTLIAIAYWLISNEACPWSDLTEEKLYNKPLLPKAAQYLKDFMYENVQETPELYVELLTGSFEFRSDKTFLSLTVDRGSSEHALPVSIDEVRRMGSSIGIGPETKDFRYEGWIIISPNDSLVCILKNKTEECNHFYIPLGVNERETWAIDPVRTIMFLNQSIAEQFSELDIDEGRQNILNIWSSGKSENIMIFQRVE